MKTDFELQKEASDYATKQAARSQAISMAERLQPSGSLSNWGGLGGAQSPEKSVTKLLADADTIYNWLIKDL